MKKRRKQRPKPKSHDATLFAPNGKPTTLCRGDFIVFNLYDGTASFLRPDMNGRRLRRLYTIDKKSAWQLFGGTRNHEQCGGVVFPFVELVAASHGLRFVFDTETPRHHREGYRLV